MEYVDELELKSLILRAKSAHIVHNTMFTGRTVVSYSCEDIKMNKHINVSVTRFIKIKKTKTCCDNHKKVALLKTLKCKIIRDSVSTPIDKKSFERLGDIIRIMAEKILTKSNFSGYSYHDEFVSDSVYKVLKYLDNFDHTIISKITGQPVNAFSYISQIIHNAVIFVINKRNRDIQFISQQLRVKDAGGTTNTLRCANFKTSPDSAKNAARRDDPPTVTIDIDTENFDEYVDKIVELGKERTNVVVNCGDVDIQSIYDLKVLVKKYKNVVVRG